MSWRLKHLYHTVINAKNLEETVAFYEMLGFRIISDRRDAVWPKGSGASFELVDAKARGVLMALPRDPDGPMLDILEWVNPKAAFAPHTPNTIPPRIIAFRTENVREAHRELKAKGVRFTTLEPTSVAVAGIVACAVAHDPNGNFIELIELEPGLRHSKMGDARAISKN